MIKKYIKNIDTIDHTYAGHLIKPNEYLLIEKQKEIYFQQSSPLISDIGNGLAQMAKSNDSNNDITDIAEQTAFLLGSQTEISNSPTVRTDKPETYSKTFISHNFCDNSTWPATNNSVWELEPESGYKYEIIKTEVQFSHDVKLGEQTTPGEFYLDFFAGGTKVDEESRVYKSIKDVFNYGNKHYTMDATVDGLAGVTTVIFDYADKIILESSLLKKFRLHLKNNAAMDGTFCTVSFIVRPVEE